jgi:DNA-binding NarL/FixJ family response regulator
MDIISPINAIDVTKVFHKFSPSSKIIGVSKNLIPGFAKRMLQLGAMGYITMSSSKEEMITAIMEVHGRREYICKEVKGIFSDLDGRSAESENRFTLSPNELTVIQLIKDGLSSKEMAQYLNVSIKTIEVHRYNILKKLNLKNTTSLINYIKSDDFPGHRSS